MRASHVRLNLPIPTGMDAISLWIAIRAASLLAGTQERSFRNASSIDIHLLG